MTLAFLSVQNKKKITQTHAHAYILYTALHELYTNNSARQMEFHLALHSNGRLNLNSNVHIATRSHTRMHTNMYTFTLHMYHVSCLHCDLYKPSMSVNVNGYTLCAVVVEN